MPTTFPTVQALGATIEPTHEAGWFWVTAPGFDGRALLSEPQLLYVDTRDELLDALHNAPAGLL